jgi:hypothetical protein
VSGHAHFDDASFRELFVGFSVGLLLNTIYSFLKQGICISVGHSDYMKQS